MNVLVLCTGNSCRSQMAHGFLNTLVAPSTTVYSAGLEAHGLNPRAVKVMAELGIDIAHHTSNTLDEYSNQNFDFVLTVCDHAKESCPVFPGAPKTVHQSFPDPARATGSEEEILAAFRTTRDAIQTWCQELVTVHGL